MEYNRCNSNRYSSSLIKYYNVVKSNDYLPLVLSNVGLKTFMDNAMSGKGTKPPDPRPPASTPEEVEADLGDKLRALRLSRDLDQAGLAARAGVSLSAVRSLEAGRGSTLHTLVRVARALGREEWFASIAPVATINPLTVLRRAQPRQRAGRRSTPPES